MPRTNPTCGMCGAPFPVGSKRRTCDECQKQMAQERERNLRAARKRGGDPLGLGLKARLPRLADRRKAEGGGWIHVFEMPPGGRYVESGPFFY